MKILLLIMAFYINTLANNLEINILYLEEVIKKPPVLSNIIEEPKDSGYLGALLAIKDSNKTAKFLNQKYILQKSIRKDKKKLIKDFENFIKEENTFVLLNVSDNLFLEILKNKISNKALLINVANKSSHIRANICQDNLLHTIASNAMLYDALAQFLIKRNWKDWLVIKGETKEDEKIYKAIKRAKKRFGANIVEEKTWTSASDIRRKAQAEMPSFTQSKDYDVVLLADYYGDFGEYVYFNTWIPRPVAGTQGLTPVTWHKVIEAWGAAQLQKRFEKNYKRWMNSKDYAAWLGVRTVLRTVSTTKNIDLKINTNFIFSDKFDLGAYKGRKLTYRNFNGQLRQPIALVHPKALVSSSPQVGFLHEKTDLDTLGIAKFEMKCSK